MLIQTREQFDYFVSRCKQAKSISLDTETTGLHPYLGDRIIGLSAYLPEFDESFYLPVRHGAGFNFSPEVLQELWEPLADPAKEYYGWNVKFDAHFLVQDGFPILQNGAIYKDVIIALHLLDENRYDPSDLRRLNYKLKDNGRLFLGVEEGEAEDELKEYLKERNISKGEMWKLPASLVHKYAEQDVILTWKLYQFFLPFLEKWRQVELFEEIARFNSTILARMEYTGVPVDRDLIQAHIQESKDKAQELLKQLQAYYGAKFNPNSPVQVSQVLHSVDARKATLDRLDDPYAEMIIDYKNYAKAENTFYKPYLYYSSFDGRVHPTFNTTRTNSGRLSSSDPNLQQTPRYSKKYRVKAVFVAPEGYTFVNIDYKREELCLACHFSGQENMTKLLVEDADIHTYTAQMMFNKKEITEEERHIGKTGNFAWLYGMGKRKAAKFLSEALKRDVSEKEAAKLLGAWRELYSKFVDKLQECAEEADTLRDGAKYFRLADGRVRHYIKGQRPFTAFNFLVQGTGGIIMRQALMKIHETFPMTQDEVIPVITVHDSIALLIKTNVLAERVKEVCSLMERHDFYPPVRVDVKIGNNWGDMHTYEWA